MTANCGRTSTGRVARRAGAHRAAGRLTPSPVPSSLDDHRALAGRLALPHLAMTACPAEVARARHHARQLMWEAGLKELIEPVELLVSELVTNAVHACAGLDAGGGTQAAQAVIRLWVVVEAGAALVLVWDASLAMPQRRMSGPDAEKGRGLALVEMLSVAWGVFEFEFAGEPGKVVWAQCQS